MSARNRSFVGIGIATLLTGFIIAGTRHVVAGPPDNRPGADFAYVGVEQTIARVDRTTGKIWILRHPDSTRASLLSMPDQRGWHWDEVAMRRERPPTSGIEPSNNEP